MFEEERLSSFLAESRGSSLLRDNTSFVLVLCAGLLEQHSFADGDGDEC